MPFEGDYTQEIYAQQLVDEYKQAGIDPSRVYLQSFRLEDILYWIENEPEFAKQAVYLDDRYDLESFDYLDPTTYDHSMQELADMGVRIIAPPIWMLLTLDADGNIVPSVYAEQAKAAGLDIITWSLERDAPLHNGGGWYHTGITDAIAIDGDVLEVLDVLAKKVGVIGVFSDWPATATFYANCMLDS
jgi:glycerophosphoryl diester phosphodiesterase